MAEALLPPRNPRSDDVEAMGRRSGEANKMASEMRDARIDITVDQLRGISVSSLLSGGAALFADGGAAARLDPAGVFALSTPVEQLDYFVSHAWRAPRLFKYLAMLCYFNLDAALVAYLVTCCVSFVYSTLFFEALSPFIVYEPPTGEIMDSKQIRSVGTAEIFASLAFFAVFFFGHLVLRRGEMGFLDISCIDQRDDSKKAAGINSLGALLDRSQRMVVLLDENNMKRMWCVFEIAAFAKRGSMERIDFVPLHYSLQKGALIAFLFAFPLFGILLKVVPGLEKSVAEGMDNANYGILGILPLFIVSFLPWLLLLVHATWQGRSTSRALQQLRRFTLAEAECYSDVDRAAIMELIGEWFADGSEGSDKHTSQEVGIHNFETFVRMDLHAKIQRDLGSGGSSQWSAEHMLLTYMPFGGAWFFDEVAVPECTLWQLLAAFTQAVGFLCASPVYGMGIHQTAQVLAKVREKCMWPHATALVIVGIPGSVLSMMIYLLAGNLCDPYAFVAGSDTPYAQMQYPDDGFEPDVARRNMKVKLVLFFMMTFVAVWIALVRK